VLDIYTFNGHLFALWQARIICGGAGSFHATMLRPIEWHRSAYRPTCQVTQGQHIAQKTKKIAWEGGASGWMYRRINRCAVVSDQRARASHARSHIYPLLTSKRRGLQSSIGKPLISSQQNYRCGGLDLHCTKPDMAVLCKAPAQLVRDPSAAYFPTPQ
jgi:hypothetical protein